MPELDFWIRIDRGPDRGPSRKPSDASSSVYPADDKVSLTHSASSGLVIFTCCSTSKVVVNYREDQLVDQSTCHPLFQSQYRAQKASLREISKVLAIFSKESTNYVLLTVRLHFAGLRSFLTLLSISGELLVSCKPSARICCYG
jgi:hypothetical protein